MSEFLLPSLGEGVDSGTVAGILVSVGDEVEEGQPLLELETGKSVVPVPAPQAGKIAAITVKEGDQVKVGQAVLSFDGGATQSKAADNSEPKAEMQGETRADAMGSVQQKGMATGMDDTEDEDTGKDKKITPPSQLGESNGSPNRSSNGVGHTLPAVAAVSAVSQEAKASSIPAAPSVRRLARELGVDLASLKGSGPGGRIGFADVKSAVQTVAPVAGSNSVPAVPLPDFAKWGNIERKPLSGIRRATAEQMARSWSTIPHVTQFDKADITELEKLRKQYGKQAETAGAKLTVTAIILKVVAGALKKFPQFNSSLDVAGNEQIFKSYYNIGVAVDTERGLMVPVVRNVDSKNIVEIAVELNQIAERARSKKTTLEEMQGGTFTITNLGGIGGTAFTPIVNAPEVAILGLSRGGMEPVWNGQSFEPRLMLPLSLSYDHRVIDGADGARFLRWICTALEQPFLMSLEG
ncbi:MAG TPA: 2-oxo acid dehydrogenase subunit E2 [Abditibacteriaceae bacterium]|jgi:pyruvate dehydrogenase E2 component (dihydrolipoamide acetyltransferase)